MKKNIEMKTITGNLNNLDGIKRFYFDCVIESKCPECSTKAIRDFNEHYINSPEIGERDTLVFYCDNCGEDWEIIYEIKEVKIKLSFEKAKVERVVENGTN